MKKVILLIIAVVSFGWTAFAQTGKDCNAILRPFYAQRGLSPDTYPAEKSEHFCNFSTNSFYFVDQLPHGAVFFSFSVLTNLMTGEKAPANTRVDLNTFSYFTYDFPTFQGQFPYKTIYFELVGNDHRYLAVRPYGEAIDRTEYPEKYKD